MGLSFVEVSYFTSIFLRRPHKKTPYGALITQSLGQFLGSPAPACQWVLGRSTSTFWCQALCKPAREASKRSRGAPFNLWLRVSGYCLESMDVCVKELAMDIRQCKVIYTVLEWSLGALACGSKSKTGYSLRSSFVIRDRGVFYELGSARPRVVIEDILRLRSSFMIHS